MTAKDVMKNGNVVKMGVLFVLLDTKEKERKKGRESEIDRKVKVKNLCQIKKGMQKKQARECKRKNKKKSSTL